MWLGCCMEEVKSLAKWWNNQMVVPRLRTSLCMLSGAWGFTLRKKLNYPNECIRVNIDHKIVIIIHVRSVIIGVFRRMKVFIIILYKLVELIEVFQIKVITLNAKVSFDRCGKKLCIICVSLGDFCTETQCWIITLTLWLEKVFNFPPRLSMVSF